MTIKCWWLLSLWALTLPLSNAFITEPGNGFQAKTDVNETMSLALDVQAMRLAPNDVERKEIYENGRNAKPLTLQMLSTRSAERWPFSPMFHIYRHAFMVLGSTQEHDIPGNFDGAPASQYADRLVLDLFDLSIPFVEAEGAVIFNVVMAYWGELFEIIETCYNMSSINDTDVQFPTQTMTEDLDQAAALWVGSGQVRGDSDTGFMLYNLAQIAGELFNQNDQGDETKINRQVLQLFVGLQNKIANNACSTPAGYITVRESIHLLVKYTNVVMVQMFLHRLMEDGERQADLVEMYALAVMPQISLCDENLYDIFLNNVVVQSINAQNRANIISALQSAYSCLNIDCKLVGGYEGDRIPECDDSGKAGFPSLASYQPKTDVRKKSRIDRDLRHMSAFLEFGDFQSARDWYEFGWNSDTTLQDIAENGANQAIDVYVNYFDDAYFPNQIIMNALAANPPFAAASVTQRAGVIMGAIQGILSFWAVNDMLHDAAQACAADRTAALQNWDAAAAYFVGSAEGQSPTGQEGGQFMFALSKKYCTMFGTCEPGSSEVNASILSLLTTGQQLLEKSDSQCTEVEKLVSDIYPHILVILIQGMISAAADAFDGDHDLDGAVLAYSRGVLPELARADAASATIINNNTNFFFEPSTTVNMENLLTAVAAAVEPTNIDCEEIGKITFADVARGLCVGDASAPTTPPPSPAPTSTAPPTSDLFDPSTAAPNSIPTNSSAASDNVPTSAAPASSGTEAPTTPIFIPEPHPEGIAWGRYDFSNVELATSDSMFSMDIKAMHSAANVTDAMLVYNSTSANVPKGLSYSGTPAISSLADLSIKAATIMSSDPFYNFFRIALYDDRSFDDVANAHGWPFGDSVVQLALAPGNGNDQILGGRAAVVMNLWMVLANRIANSVRMCKQGSVNSTLDLIDSAVALWIGQEQGEGMYRSGWMLYRVAQDAAMLYGNAEGEARVNKELMTLFVSLQQSGSQCKADDQSAYLSFRALADEVTRLLSVPLLQNLLYHISDDAFEYVELYSLSFIPQAVSCNEGTYYRLRDALYEGFIRDDAVTEEFKAELAKLLVCLRMECADLGDVSTAETYLKDLVTDLCGRLDEAQQEHMIAGYAVSTLEAEVERVDLDVHHMELFMRVGAYDLAKEIYENGKNMIITGSDQVHSLKAFIDEIPSMETGGMYQMFLTYYKSADYMSGDIVSVLETGQNSRFSGASRRQLSEAAFRMVQTMVSFMLVLGKLNAAVEMCSKGQGGQQQVDEAVAFFVGSMEGRNPGGDLTKHGRMLFALAKEVCNTFGKCDGLGESTTNEFLMFAFSDIKENLDDSKCDDARSLVGDTIVPMILVPLVQGTLYFANINAALPAQANNASLAAGDILSRSVLPLVQSVNPSSGTIINDNMEFSRSAKPVGDGVAAVFNAFAAVMSGMEIDCNAVGRLGEFDVCPQNATSQEEQPPIDTPTNLGDNLYVTTTYVQDRADIALDVKEMEALLAAPGGHEGQAVLIYKEGKNSEIYDSSGKRVDFRSLASFATNASVKNPLYTIAVFALRDSGGLYLGKNSWLYTDTIVQESFKSKTTLAAEAAVALNLWMEIANELYSTVALCRSNSVHDDDGVHSIDVAVAYWIGDGQVGGDPKQGHLLYRLAEQMAEHFGLDESGQSRTNSNILKLFTQAKLELSLPAACADQSTVRRIRQIVNHIVSQMIALSIQALIHYLRVEDRERVRVYAHAVVPLVVGCSPASFKYLRSKLIDTSFPAAEVEKIIQVIYSTLPCFGLQCDDIGKHYTEAKWTCADPKQRLALAGYTPYADVREERKIDLDIFEMDILMQMQAYDAAQEVYMYGKHVLGSGDGQPPISLQSLAKVSERSKAPELKSYKVFFSGDERYADTLVTTMFTNTDNYGNDERRAVILGLCSYMIMFTAAVDEMYESIAACESGQSDRQDSAIVFWDRSAAFMTGQLEGTSEAGSDEGVLLWSLAKDNCAEFNTCSQEVSGSAVVNDRISTVLYSGRGAILGKNCGELRKAAVQLVSLMQSILIQASLSSTSKLSKKPVAAEKAIVQGEAYSYSTTVLPPIFAKDREAADVIKRNLALKGEPLVDGAPAVASAFSSSMPKIGVDCDYVGASLDIKSCTGEVKKPNVGLIVGCVLGALALIVIICLICRNRLKRRKRTAETQEFIPSKGELNHTSDLAPEQPAIGRENAETDDLMANDAEGNIEEVTEGAVDDMDDVEDVEDMDHDRNGEVDKDKDPNSSHSSIV